MCKTFTGNFDKVKIYSDDPLNMALQWQKKGAEFLHIVDLTVQTKDLSIEVQ